MKYKKLLISKDKFDVQVYKPNYQLCKMKWEFHQYDDDPFPSIPHGHCGQFKLDTVNGYVYRGKTKVGELKQRELDRLNNDKKFIELKEKAIEYYNSIKTIRKQSIVRKYGMISRRVLAKKGINRTSNLRTKNMNIPKDDGKLEIILETKMSQYIR